MKMLYFIINKLVLFRNAALKTLQTYGFSHNATITGFSTDPVLQYQSWLKQKISACSRQIKVEPLLKDAWNHFPLTVIVISRGDSFKLKMTLSSLVSQSYTHWQCLVTAKPGEKQTKDRYDINNVLASFPSWMFRYIGDSRGIFNSFKNTGGIIGFLEEGEILRPDCLREFTSVPYPDTQLVYSDHDYINAEGWRCDPWFTFNWSPDLLLSSNYIGGFFLFSVDLLFSAIQTDTLLKYFLNNMFDSAAWRYGILLALNLSPGRIRRIPEVLWSAPRQSLEDDNLMFVSECNEVRSFLEQKGLKAKIETDDSHMVRYIKWEIESTPWVSVIIPTTGNMQYLENCLNTLINVTEYSRFDVILLDNGRGAFPEGIEYARKQGIEVIECNEAFNWSKLNNKGVGHSKGELLLFLNDDVEITDPAWLSEMVRQAVRKDVGTVGSLLLYPDGTIQHAGVFLVDHGGGARHLFYKQWPGKGNYHDLDLCVREVSANTGACIMISKEKFLNLGGFNESLSMVFNDIDLCLRCLEAGFRNIWTPHSRLIHHESVSRKQQPFIKDEKVTWKRWSKLLLSGDYYYNPNLTLISEDCSFKEIGPHSGRTRSRPKLLNEKSNFGVNMIAYIRAEMGLGEAARGNARALNASGIPFCIINYEKGNPGNMGDLSEKANEVQKFLFDINIVFINADNTPKAIKNLGEKKFKGKYTIGYWLWELPVFPDKWLGSFEFVDEIWVPSPFINHSISIKSPVPVITIPIAINIEKKPGLDVKSTRASFSISENAFVFLSMFDINSISQRKNPFGSVIAFKSAFRSDDMNVVLVIKVTGSDKIILKALLDTVGEYKNIVLIKQRLDRNEIISLLSVTDCYVSLHRSEGFGMGPAEAMALGKVALLTNWSANTQYMTSSNCIPIGYELKHLGQDYGPYDAHQYWAEPDVNQASAEMKKLVSHPETVKSIGENAKMTIETEFSARKIGEMMKQRLSVIERKMKTS